VLLLLCAAPACAQGPGAALSPVRIADSPNAANAKGIRYRALTRAVFRAAHPPVAGLHGDAHMNAFTCATIVSQGRIELELRQERPGEPFVARPENPVFVAVMDRDCSWWNPQQDGEAYVLQHEQVHFAIVEAAARALTRRAREIVAQGASPQTATDAFQRRLEPLFREAIDATTARHARFDRETSGRRDPKRQQRWYDEVSAELAR
jgi:hypothetical protein